MKSIKVVLVGSSKVGKSCIINRLVQGSFDGEIQTTVGAAFITKLITTPNGPVRLQIWDTAGQEKFRSIAPMYYRSSSFAVLVFDVTDNLSFQNLEDWADDIADNAPYNIKLILVGNKIDLVDLRCVSREDAQEYSESLNCVDYCETSAKTGEGVNELFLKIAELDVPEEDIIEKRIQAQEEENQEKKTKRCC